MKRPAVVLALAMALGGCAQGLQVVHPETRSEPQWRVVRQAAPGPPQAQPAAPQQGPQPEQQER